MSVLFEATGVPEDVLAGIVSIAANQQAHESLEDAGRACGFCAEPVHLRGRSSSIDRGTGEILESFSSADQPTGELLKPCGTRRATRCPSCSATYQGDARQLVRAGMIGGKGVEESVGSHPMVFATLTAPSFGVVHRRPNGGGPCEAKGPGRCPHGRPVSCLAHHGEQDPMLGEPLCPDCHDYEGAVLFNASLSELWRRTTIYTRRQLARLAGMTAAGFDALVRISYVRTAEFQRRGVVHLHVILRLDAKDGGAPPRPFSAAMLAMALRIAAAQVKAPYPDGRGEARWGSQLDTCPLDGSSPDQIRKIVNYLAKYATKGSDDAGALDRRIRSAEDLAQRKLSPHLRKMAETAWRLGGDPALAALRLRSWAHTLGLRSHFLTKSRRFSTTFTALRAARQIHRRAERFERSGITLPGIETLVVVSEWEYAGRGWKSRAERYLVAEAARRAAEARRLAYEERLLAQEPLTLGVPA